MRYALNNLQATSAGFDKVINRENVFKVCDQPHPEIIRNVVLACLKGKFTEGAAEIDKIFNEGYNLVDIVHSLTRVI